MNVYEKSGYDQIDLIRKIFCITFIIVAPLINCGATAFAAGEKIIIGSKMHGESYLLAEIMAQLLENNGYEVDRKFGFGGTLICYNALVAGEIDIYPEYTGTISEAILAPEERPDDSTQLTSYQRVLGQRGLDIFSRFGFNNSYVITVKKTLSEARGIKTISDLRDHPDLVASFSHEFLNRDDGWPKLKEAYGLDYAPSGIQHGLAYRAMDEREIDMTDAFSTDGDIERYGLTLLEDDLNFFPKYYGAVLARTDFPMAAKSVLLSIENMLNDQKMRELNARVVLDQQSFAVVAGDFLSESGMIRANTNGSANLMLRNLLRNTLTHIKLTFIALVTGCVVGLIVAFLIFRSQLLSRYVIYIAGLMQTIPSIALLALMIPLLGIGEVPAITALFLYSLLPILRNAITALTTIDPILTNVSRAIGMTRYQQLRHVLLPLALPNILAGVKTAAVICIGTATLAAFIGAGGLGEPIVTGLALNDTSLILQGAIPAACLAIIVEILFELMEKRLIPDHMRQSD